ncbi:MAG: ParB/RepB/Spo0J family partition protein [Clostridia bacterium]|nr:ParB/RepB/Spo0J family partition protein [Clostridia bacterium]
MAEKKGGLGRGLDSLFDMNSDEKTVTEVLLSEIEPNRDQPRKDFDENALSELSASISKHGLLQPILVRTKVSGGYEIIAGERRWRACRMAGLRTVPVVIKEMDEREVMEAALIENLQREDLNAVEEALGYRSLMVSYGLTQEDVASAMGKSRSAVANTLRLLELTPTETEHLKSGKITAGHARVLLSVEKNSSLRAELLKAALAGASVRELEKLLKFSKLTPTSSKPDKAKNNFYTEVELAIKNQLGRKVEIKSKGKGKGTLTIEFYSDKELSDFADRLTK